jgi:hypothetical protein
MLALAAKQQNPCVGCYLWTLFKESGFLDIIRLISTLIGFRRLAVTCAIYLYPENIEVCILLSVVCVPHYYWCNDTALSHSCCVSNSALLDILNLTLS